MCLYLLCFMVKHSHLWHNLKIKQVKTINMSYTLYPMCVFSVCVCVKYLSSQLDRLYEYRYINIYVYKISSGSTKNSSC